MPLTHDIRVRIPYRLHEERRIRYPALFSYPRATHPGRKAPAREVFRPPPSPGPHCPVLEEPPNGRLRTPPRARAPEGSPNGRHRTPLRTALEKFPSAPDPASHPCPRKFPERKHKHTALRHAQKISGRTTRTPLRHPSPNPRKCSPQSYDRRIARQPDNPNE